MNKDDDDHDEIKPKLVRVDQVLKVLDIGRTLLRKLERKRKLVPVRVSSRCLRYLVREIDEYIEVLARARDDDPHGPGRPRTK